MKEGDSVYFFDLGWRTGVFLSEVDDPKSDHFGMYRVKPNFFGQDDVYVEPEKVERLKSELDKMLE